MGAIRIIVILFFHLVVLSTEAFATSKIETNFETASETVQSRLLEAPEASFFYLNHWIDVYNEMAQETSQLTFDQRPTRPIESLEDYAPSKELTSWSPNGTPIVSPHWGHSKPLSFTRPDQFRAAPPPQPNSKIFERDLEEVFRLGEKYGESRPTEGSVMAAFWADGIGTVTPPGRWNLIALKQSQALSQKRRIKLMLALNIALYDAGIAAWDSKYHYNYWRPTQAITTLYPEHADWTPMLEPPFHPEYVSGHSAFSGAAAAILEAMIGHTEFCVTSDELLGLTRCFSSFTDAAQQAGRSRIYGGIHYEFSNQSGQKIGQDVANQVLTNFAKYLK